MIRVVLSEAHPLLRQGLVSVLERADDIVVLATSSTAPATLALDERHVPDVHLIGSLLPPTTGYEAARQLSRRRQGAGIVIMAPARPTDGERAGLAYRALSTGARGYLAGEADAVEILCAVRAVATGNAYLAAPVLLEVVEEVQRQASGEAVLTPEHWDVLTMLRRGLTNMEIAVACGVSLSTVKRRIHELEAAFGVHGRLRVAVQSVLPETMPPILPGSIDADGASL
jgi:DNA-binding NarL/FixJ family response regulator